MVDARTAWNLESNDDAAVLDVYESLGYGPGRYVIAVGAGVEPSPLESEAFTSQSDCSLLDESEVAVGSQWPSTTWTQVTPRMRSNLIVCVGLIVVSTASDTLS